MEYFCYISRTKVDQLFQGLSGTTVEEWTEQKSTTNEVALEASSDWSIGKILSLFKAGITYGRKGVLQREAKVKATYLGKLRAVLLAAAQEGPIEDISIALASGERSRLLYAFDGHFRLKEPIETPRSETVVTLTSEIGQRKMQIDLDCSLRFFSEGNEPDGRFILHSSNMRFFRGGMWLRMSTIFIPLQTTLDTVVGTPLFLKLMPDADVFL